MFFVVVYYTTVSSRLTIQRPQRWRRQGATNSKLFNSPPNLVPTCDTRNFHSWVMFGPRHSYIENQPNFPSSEVIYFIIYLLAQFRAQVEWTLWSRTENRTARMVKTFLNFLKHRNFSTESHKPYHRKFSRTFKALQLNPLRRCYTIANDQWMRLLVKNSSQGLKTHNFMSLQNDKFLNNQGVLIIPLSCGKLAPVAINSPLQCVD